MSLTCWPAALKFAIMELAHYNAVLATPFGALGVRTEGEWLTEVVYLPPRTPVRAPDNAIAQTTVEQLERYLQDPDYRFDLPLGHAGTAFQQRVWAEISSIPRGRVQNYGALAQRLKSAARAVGQACGANPFPPIVPCHRVVSASGIGGFANHRDGFLIATKRWLLAHEECPL